MFTDVYIGLVKSEKFDYDKPGDVNGYSPDYACGTMHPRKKPSLAGEREIFWDILEHPGAKKTDWGCYVVKMTGKEMIEYLSQESYRKNDYARFLIKEITNRLDLNAEYLLAAKES